MTDQQLTDKVKNFNLLIHFIIFMANGLLAISTGGMINFFFCFLAVCSWTYIQCSTENLKLTLELIDDCYDKMSSNIGKDGYTMIDHIIEQEYMDELISSRISR